MKLPFSKTETILFVLVLMLFVIGFAVYSSMPETMASHWDINGQVNGTTGKFVGVFLFPGIIFFTWILFILIPRIDPLRENIRQFRSAFDTFIVVLFLFLSALYVYSLLWNVGIKMNINRFISGGFAIVIYATGSLCAKAKRNYFIGIRTPWTLNSDSVWDKTHKLGSVIFRWIALVIAFGIFLPEYTFWLFIGPLVIGVLYVVIYSYVEYEREQKAAS